MKKYLILLLFLNSLFYQSSFGQTKIWGTGYPIYYNYDGGSIYYTDNSTSSVTIAHQFNFSLLGTYNYKCQLVQSSITGKVYGMTFTGGTNNKGVLFEYDPATITYTIKHDMDSLGGYYPDGGMMEASDGKFYGTTNQKGGHNKGVLFEYDPVLNIYTKLIDFDSINGSGPTGKLLQAASGKIYGVTSAGGVSNQGTLFEFDITTHILSKKVDFSGFPAPIGNIIQATNGKLYGLTHGGIYGYGSLYEYDIASDLFTDKHDFNSSTSGVIEDLFQASNGKLYGATTSGGSGYGTIYEYDITSNTYTTKYSFSALGKNPMIMCSSAGGIIYGSCNSGGVSNTGVFFKYDPIANIYTKELDYGAYGDDMKLRCINTMSDGNVLGLTCSATVSTGERGTIVAQINPVTSAYQRKIGTNSVSENTPVSLIRASNGKMYGVTFQGGDYDHGVLFEYDPATAIYTKKYAFDSIDGSSPYSNLVTAFNGKIYGTTNTGGSANRGVLFEYDPVANIYLKTHDFGTIIQDKPYTNIMCASNGKIYGITKDAASVDAYCGALYEYDPNTHTYTVREDSIADGGYGSRMQMINASNGLLYGIAETGGTYGGGYIFSFDPVTYSFVKRYNFNCSTGCGPNGSMVEWSPGKLYGITNDGGTNSTGVVYEYNILTNTYTKKYDFPVFGVSGGSGSNGFVRAANNKLYADMAAEDKILEYDPASGSYTLFSPFGGSIVYSQGSRLLTMNCLTDCDVWPGDADNSNLVDNNDLLPIGLYYGQTGFIRASINNLWQADSSADWGTTEINTADIKHADCNGDGVIDSNDTLAVNLNFSSIHYISLPPDNINIERNTNPDLYFQTTFTNYLPGDWVDVDVMVGTGSLPVTDLYGIAFNIHYDASLVQPGTENISYPNSWFATPGTNAIRLSKIISLANIAYGAETRINHINSDGFGKIATLRFQIKNTISANTAMALSFSGYSANDSSGTNIFFNLVTDSIHIIPLTTNLNQNENANEVSIYPNPYSDATNISYSLKEKSTVNIEIYNAIGQYVQTIMDSDQSAGKYQYIFSAKEKGFDPGIYFVKITVNGKTTMRRIVEMK